MKKRLFIFPLTLAIASLVACSTGTQTSYNAHSLIEIKSTQEGELYRPEEVEITETIHSFSDKQFFNFQRLPSVGNIKILVIPILIPEFTTIDIDNDGKDDKNLVKNDINLAFFGNDNEKIGYESVASFYEKSSYGQLHLSGTVTDWFDATRVDGVKTPADVTAEKTMEIVDEAVAWAKDTLKIDYKDYDNDKDGYIDGIWCVYSAPNYMNGGPNLEDMNYWAYTSWGNQNKEGDVNSPIYNLFGWASYDFMYEGYGTKSIDAHTYIHETGHFLGLSDYYSTDSLSYSPLGRVDMMDANIIDHNSYSKMLLGWTKPYLAFGSCDIDLYSFQNKNALIVVQDDTVEPSKTFNPFSEYILIEVYSNDGLNYKDSRVALGSTNLLAPSTTGVRIYHVDKRPYLIYEELGSQYGIKLYENEEIKDGEGLATPISNSRATDIYNYYFNLPIETNLLDEIRLIEANGVDSFSTGGKQTVKSYFKQGDEFSMDKYGTFFIDGKFNNGNKMSKVIKIGEVVDE